MHAGPADIRVAGVDDTPRDLGSLLNDRGGACVLANTITLHTPRCAAYACCSAKCQGGEHIYPPVRPEHVEGLFFLSTSKARTVLRQAQHERRKGVLLVIADTPWAAPPRLASYSGRAACAGASPAVA